MQFKARHCLAKAAIACNSNVSIGKGFWGGPPNSNFNQWLQDTCFTNTCLWQVHLWPTSPDKLLGQIPWQVHQSMWPASWDKLHVDPLRTNLKTNLSGQI
eukprot:2380762-Amphidinium_carterae.1